MSASSAVPLPEARFPDVVVEIQAEDWNRRHAGSALRAKTRLALEHAGHASESLDYLTATRDLQDEAARDELVRITRGWVNVVIVDPLPHKAPGESDANARPIASDRSTAASDPAVAEVQHGRQPWFVLAIIGIWSFSLLGGCTALFKSIESSVYEDVDHEFGPTWAFAVAALFPLAGSMLVRALAGADRGWAGLDRVLKVYVVVLFVLTVIGLIGMGTAIGR